MATIVLWSQNHSNFVLIYMVFHFHYQIAFHDQIFVQMMMMMMMTIHMIYYFYDCVSDDFSMEYCLDDDDVHDTHDGVDSV